MHNINENNNNNNNNLSVAMSDQHIGGFQESRIVAVNEKDSAGLILTTLDSTTFNMSSNGAGATNVAGPNDVHMITECSMNHMMDSHFTPQLDSGFQTASTTGWPPSTPCPPYEHVAHHNQTASLSHQTHQQGQSNFIQSNNSSPLPVSVAYTTLQPVASTQPCSNHMPPSPPQIAQQPQQPPITSSTYNNEATSMTSNGANNIESGLLPDVVNGQALVQEFEKIMTDSNDDVVLTNSVCLLFRFSIDSVRGYDVCQAMSSCSSIMNLLYYIINTDQYNGYDLKNTMLCYATGNLTSISKFEECRGVLLSHGSPNLDEKSSVNYDKPSPGVKSLLRSLQIDDINVIIFAMTAIHNLLLDRRLSIQQMAKQQIKHGLRDILALLDRPCLAHDDKFKVIVLDCLQILAYRNMENRLLIKQNDGPRLILQTIRTSLMEEYPNDELIETASRVLKSLSACPENKIDIIRYNGIEVLTSCIDTTNPDIMKTCLWTLRNLSDVISNNEAEHYGYIMHLIDRILRILEDYAEEQSIITCALGILANLTCNNESIKQQICNHNGVELLIRAIGFALRETSEFWIVDKEILEPAICALCHLVNQTDQPVYAENARSHITRNFDIFQPIMEPNVAISNELWKAVKKLDSLTFKRLNVNTN